MKNINIKSAIISASIVWTLAVIAFVASYLVPIMSDPDLQANWVLSIALIPSALIGAHIYYRKGHKTNGFVLGVFMFLVAMLLDALITVPVLIMPHGGNHISFFTDPGFWLIGVELVSVVAAYWQIEKAVKSTKLAKA
ncbi:MAG: hypothetical protein DHS20C17_01480 [Cyclobacteriaceae bacterium]|nr:MAG: hypothetical protein DHS20C17_01480 [Cyclobacteriaceae bacterium]